MGKLQGNYTSNVYKKPFKKCYQHFYSLIYTKYKMFITSLIYKVKAETEGFEPSIQFPVYTLSRRAPSTTRTSLLILFSIKPIHFFPPKELFGQPHCQVSISLKGSKNRDSCLTPIDNP